MTAYISRDLFPDGTLSLYVDVWSAKPILIPNFDGPATQVWISNPDRWHEHALTMLTVRECRDLYGVVPEHVRQLIKAPYRRSQARKPRITK